MATRTYSNLTTNLGKFGLGDDNITISNNVRQNGSIDLGEGNNTLTIGKSTWATAGHHRFIFGSGNDVFNVGINLDGQNTINLGEGNNQLHIGSSTYWKQDGYIGAGSKSTINFGSGNDVMTVRTNIDGKNTINFGEGKNSLKVGNYLIGTNNISFGSDEDVVTVGTNIDGYQNINFGAGANKLTVGGYLTGINNISFGEHNDVMTIGSNIAGKNNFAFGEGDNTLTIGNYLIGTNSITFGHGNNYIKVGSNIDGYQDIRMEGREGANTIEVGGYVIGHNTISMGYGVNTINIASNINGKQKFYFTKPIEQDSTDAFAPAPAIEGIKTLNVGGHVTGDNYFDLRGEVGIVDVKEYFTGKNTVLFETGYMLVGSNIDGTNEILMQRGGGISVGNYLTGNNKIVFEGAIYDSYVGPSDDVLVVASNVDGRENIDFGSGDNKFQVGGYLTGNNTVTFLEGNDELTVSSNINGIQNINFGDGENSLTVGGYLTGRGNAIVFGEDDDSISISSNIDGWNHIDLGNGDNVMKVGGYLTGANTILFGNGDDVLSVASNIDGTQDINLGEGNNVVSVGGWIRNAAAVNFGDGDDVLITEGGIMGGVLGTGHVNMGAGDDFAYVAQIGNGLLKEGFKSGVIDMGEGNDNLVLAGDIRGNKSVIEGGDGFDTLTITAHDLTQNLSHIHNFEMIDLSQAKDYELNITAKDLIANNDSNTLYIRGIGENVTVDLGDNNHSLFDGTAAASGSGTWYNAGTQEIDGITYVQYLHNAHPLETLFIEQGIHVI